MTDQVQPQAGTATDETQVVDANKQDPKITLEAATEEMRQARAEAARYRTERNELAKQIADLSKKAEKGSELEKTLAEINGKFASLELQSAFYDKAHAAGVKNLRLAFLAAKDADMFDKRGEVDFDKLKQSIPELFTSAQSAAKTNAGDGTNNPSTKVDMNSLIRRASGRG